MINFTADRFLHNLVESGSKDANEAMEHIGLLDAVLDLDPSNITELASSIEEIAAWDATEVLD